MKLIAKARAEVMAEAGLLPELYERTRACAWTMDVEAFDHGVHGPAAEPRRP